MEITTASTERVDDILEVWEASVRATHDFLSEKDIQAYKALIGGQYLQSLNLFCVKEEDSIAGFIGLQGRLIQMLFIHPKYVAKGLGKALVNFAISKHGATEVDVNEQNTKALGFYKSLGFEVVDRFEIDDAGKPYPVLSMSLK